MALKRKPYDKLTRELHKPFLGDQSKRKNENVKDIPPPKIPRPRNLPVLFSDIISQDAANKLSQQDVFAGPSVDPEKLWRVKTEKHTPRVTSFEPKDHMYLTEQILQTTLPQSDFPLHAYTPKVQLAFAIQIGQCPRRLEIEKRRRKYASQNLAKILRETYNILTKDLMPRNPLDDVTVILNEDPDYPDPFPPYLPLHIFDNNQYDDRTPQEFIDLGIDGNVRKPVPALALIPGNDADFLKDPTDPSIRYDWYPVGVLDYDPFSEEFLVHRVNAVGRVVDKDNCTVINGGIKIDGRHVLLPCQTWLPRIRVMFKAEEPAIFAKRIAEAVRLRHESEARIRYHLYIDNMPIEDVSDLDPASFRRMMDFVISTPRLRKQMEKDPLAAQLQYEVELDYKRSMNRVLFDKVVQDDPETFAYVTLQPSATKAVPAKARYHDVPEYPFEEQRAKFRFRYVLSPHPETLNGMEKVRAECNRVSYNMSLFYLPTPKPLRIEAFEQTQSQACSQVGIYLTDIWIKTLRTCVRSCLFSMGKGWYNIHQNIYEIYKMSQLRLYLEYIKYMMQDSLRFLVQDSLTTFAQVVVDACISTFTVPETFVWGEDIFNSPFRPKRQALFVVDLIINPEEVTFSTKPEAFENCLMSLFDRGIAVTQNVPQLHKFIMEELFWADTLLLESVGKKEPLVVELRETIRRAIQKAAIPLNAYAKQYVAYLELNNIDIPEFIKIFKSKPHTPVDIQKAVQSYVDLQTAINNDMPSSILIGPFMVNIEVIRQNLLKKCKAISTALLSMYAASIRKRAEECCDNMKAISYKLYDKPNCIEELVDMKEWMKTIPERIKDHIILVTKLNDEYSILDDFMYNMPDDDFCAKWDAAIWPSKIDALVEKTLENLTLDEERYQKLQVSDAANFEERISALQLSVAGIQTHSDMERAHEIAIEMRRLNKHIKECQQLVSLYNGRERIFNMPITSYESVVKLSKDFEPYRILWITTSDWLRWQDSWMNDPLSSLNAEDIERNVNEAYKAMHKSVKFFQNIPAVLEIAAKIKVSIEDFKPYIPLIQGLRNPGMRNRHWDQLSAEVGFPLKPKPNLNFKRCLEMNLQDHIDSIAKVAEIAGKEYSLEQALDKMEADWENLYFEVTPYKNTGTYIQKTTEEISQLLDDHIVMTQSMSFSPYKAIFEARITAWEETLRTTQDVLDEWNECQRAWMYLEPIFSSDDITRQLPMEAKRYQTMERLWHKIMKQAHLNPKIIELCPSPGVLKILKQCNELLELVQKGLSEYLETKRTSFPRFYFLSDDELLEILSQTRDPTAVQPHLRKCFENIYRLKFEPDLKISQMFSAEGEMIELREILYPVGNVEDWLLELERIMRDTLRKVIKEALGDYKTRPRPEFVLKWPGQVVIAVCQTYWSAEVTEALSKQSLKDRFNIMLHQLDDLRKLVRQKISSIGRMTLSALIVIEVHARDVVNNMVQEQVNSANAFEWISQLRYYWMTDENLYQRAVNAQFPYGYEYLGNTTRLVITPLTDRCYLTLTGALHLKFGGAPAGPAGTGKTETTKDLGKAFAIQCVVFNCSDQLDVMAMGKFFKGLASSGAWACFDEFNRIDIEVLSVVAQQVTTIQKAQQENLDRFIFEGIELNLKASCAVFITMNPGYAGRTELPDNLKALFRPVAMMVPDYTLIAEISLFSFGFADAKNLAKKITTTFKLSSEQLSSQDHYDFGMRAVKSVISAAGNLKRQNPDMNEELMTLRAIRDVNVPKFLVEDLKLFSGIVSDLFPSIREEPIDYGNLDLALKSTCVKNNLIPVEGFLKKCIQLYETTVVRHGLMLVGPTVSGKTQCYEVLKKAMTSLKGEMSPSGALFEPVHTFVLNPKSITMGQLYGEFDLFTHEWTDGILSSLIRLGSASEDKDKRWYVFDGPVDAVWIENMNTVLDDNKKLCLTSGEIIKLTEAMTMMFEVADLAVASPATVSRCGMVYLEPSYIGLEPFVECWLHTLNYTIAPFKDNLRKLFNTFMQPAIKFLRTSMKEIVGSVDGGLVFSLVKLLDCLFEPFIPREGIRRVAETNLKNIPQLLEPWFIFALIWTIGATCDNDSRNKFSEWLRKKMEEAECAMPFPHSGLVYDYKLDDGMTSVVNSGEGEDVEEDEEGEDHKKGKNIQWRNWFFGMPKYQVTAEMSFYDILVPTIDTIRSAYIVGELAKNFKPVLAVGPTGTGKTVAITDQLLRSMPKEFLPEFIVFSAKTSSNQTQDLMDAKLDKRRKGVFGPPLGKFFVFFIDDLNMPAREVYGAQPPIELIRQFMDFRGWYDRKAIGEFRKLVDINFVCAMGPPGGGRNVVTARLLRHFNYLGFTEMEDQSKYKIFSVILKFWLDAIPTLSSLCEVIVNTCIDTYNTIQTQLLPTPAKSHYTFNLRDLAKVFQGMLMADSKQITTTEDLLGLWYHESCRVFQDRLVNDEDRNWFDNLLDQKMETCFNLNLNTVVNQKPHMFCHFMSDENAYGCVRDHPKLVRLLEEFLEDYNQINTTRMRLVLFMDAVKHVCRIARVIRQPLGNALLLGMGGSGRQSLTRLAAHVSEFECFQIELSKNYGVTEWRDDLKKVMMKAGLEGMPVVFLFSDTQIKKESFLEDINNILNAGDVPNIYVFDDLEQIYTAMKSPVLEAKLQPTKTNLFSLYTKFVRSNLHTVITMSPLGEIFRARLRQFPALVNCCTINWFSEWPTEALQSVALRYLNDTPDLDCSEEVLQGVVSVCKEIHQTVTEYSTRYLIERSRYNYVTPTSYLELLGVFSKLIGMKRVELTGARKRLKTGLDKLLATAEEVAVMKQELAEMGPQLEAAVAEAKTTMEQISQDTAVAEETKTVVQTQQAAAAAKAEVAQAIADDAQRDLNEALPALDAALQSLKSLNKNDIVEVRAMQRPPEGVRLVIEAVCIMKGIKPKRVATDKPGIKVDDYWEVGKAALQEPQKFLDSLFSYDKDNIPDDTIKKIQPYIDNESFQPAAIAKVSKACTSICQWARAMHTYHFVAKVVAPKREALRQASAELDETQKVLDAAMNQLKEVELGLQKLQQTYNACVKRKKDLVQKCKECEARLLRADKLIGGLSGEKDRWMESVNTLESLLTLITGDVLISSGAIAYLGPFTGDYRQTMIQIWVEKCDEFNVPRTKDPNLINTMSNPVKIRNWQIAGLPKDNLSVENGVIVEYSKRWSLFIDPQGQANKWIKNTEKGNGLDVIKQSDKDFLRTMENSVRFGKPCLLENVGTELDPALEPILLKQTFKQQGSLVIKLGDSVIPYHTDFKFFMTTKLPNPHYTPEVSTKVTLVNFMLSPSGLQDQLLGIVVAEERPDLEEAKSALILNNAQMKSELKEIEDKILYRLSVSEGSPVDDLDLIQTLEASKIKSDEIKAKVEVAEKTEISIDQTRSQYIPVAINTQILFFCVADMASIDPMYQYSLEWFVGIFVNSIRNAAKADTLEGRIHNISENFTFNLFCNVCRSLFEKHKLMFAFLLCSRLNQHKGIIKMEEYRHLVAGGTTRPIDLPNPAPDWISERSWNEILLLAALEAFYDFVNDFENHLKDFKAIFDSLEPHREPLPEIWDAQLDKFQKLLVLKALRLDKVTNAMQDYVAENLGQRFIEPQATVLKEVFKDSSATSPLVFVLSTGTDPAADLYKLAEEMKFNKRLNAISLGQGQGPLAEELMKMAMLDGKWVFFQNCHLAPSWMSTLEQLVEQIDPKKVQRDFRLWLTSMPSDKFPVFILQNGSKMTVEPPKGIKANLLKSYSTFTDDFLDSCQSKTSDFRHLLLSLCLFHGTLLERRKFGALGFNIPYEFTDGDLRICISQLKMFLLEYDDIPFKVLKYTAGHINYGGRVTDDWDRRCLMSVLSDYYHQDVLQDDHKYSESGIYHQLPSNLRLEGYNHYLLSLPINDSPEVFGLHDNANITFAQNETLTMLEGLLALQPKTASGAGKSPEEVMDETARNIMNQIPVPIPIGPVVEKYPVMYEQSINTVLLQEIIRYNRLLKTIHQSLSDLLKALKGFVVMSQELESMAQSLYNNAVPTMWAKNAYPSLKPLGSWVLDLVQRVAFIQNWIDQGIPSVFWISGFYFPQAFLTGTLQNFARKMKVPIDTISFDFKIMKNLAELTTAPQDGCYIRGLFIEGARWDPDLQKLSESRPKELFTDMPPIWLIPAPNRPVPLTGIYECPLYKTLTRAGTLSTTGHSTNFVFAVEIPTSETQNHWIKRGVAMLCALNY